MSLTDPAKGGVISTPPPVPRGTPGVLLPAEPSPSLTMTPEQYAAFARTFRADTEHAVRMLDPLPIGSDQKHEIVKDAIVSVGVAKLQGSVKELRGVPPEALAFAADALISLTIRLIRRAAGGGV